MNPETLSIIIQVATLGGVIFAIYKFFRDPDIKADKSITILDRELKEQKRTASEALKVTQNCIKTFEAKQEILIQKVEEFGNRITRLETIIDERIPKKDNSGS